MAERAEEPHGRLVVTADDGVRGVRPVERLAQGVQVLRLAGQGRDAGGESAEGDFPGDAEEAVAPVRVGAESARRHEVGDVAVSALEQVRGDAPPCVDVVDGDEVAVAAVDGGGDVGVDEDDGNLRVAEDAHDFTVGRVGASVEEGPEDDALDALDDQFAGLSPERRCRVPDAGGLDGREDDAVADAPGDPLQLGLEGDEVGGSGEVGDEQAEASAQARAASRHERADAVALRDEILPNEFAKGAAHGLSRGREPSAQLGLARQLAVRELPFGDVLLQLADDVLVFHVRKCIKSCRTCLYRSCVPRGDLVEWPHPCEIRSFDE